MKHLKNLLLALTLSSALSGCAVWDAYFMAGYDSGEYSLVTKIRTEAEYASEKCSNPTEVRSIIDVMYFEAATLHNYTQHIPNNENASKLAKNLKELVYKTREMYYNDRDPSEAYCKAKLTLVAKNAENVQKVLGSKPR